MTPADAASGFGGVVLFLAAIGFTQRLANLVPSWYLRGAARSVIERRPAAGFDARDPEAVSVDVVPRAGWGKPGVRPFSDVGLLKVDDLARCLWFEGDQERWCVPAASLISVEVESYRGPGHVEGQQKGEVDFTTVIRARAGAGIWEAPVAKCHVELRPKGNRLREANAIALRDRIHALRPDGTLGPRRAGGFDAG